MYPFENKLCPKISTIVWTAIEAQETKDMKYSLDRRVILIGNDSELRPAGKLRCHERICGNKQIETLIRPEVVRATKAILSGIKFGIIRDIFESISQLHN